ncbi:MAG: Holliday junction branch migration protein RuvA [Kiritimatiellaeota bacterium]|nr:Holliday junction branch migration protein RuvA [Kiritimatiellota bacterium]
MIARLSGTLIQRDLTEIVVDVGGIGLAVVVPMSTYDNLPVPGSAVNLYTHLQVREDALTLYGFATVQERELFRLLITVSGIGTRLALNVLSCMSVTEFCRNILGADIKALSRISGVGKRSAERLVVELRERVEGIEPAAAFPAAAGEGPLSDVAQDAVAALETLGFKGDQARRTVRKAMADLPEGERSAEVLIRHSLRILNS